MRKDIFIETRNVGKLKRAMEILADTERGQAGMAVVEGAAGRGKTVAAHEWHSVNGGIFLRVLEGWSQFGFMQELAYDLSGDRPNSTQKCRVRIMEALDTKPQPIIVDEADRLAIQRIEDLRDIHDLTGCPIIMIGEDGFKSKLLARKRIHSRITQMVEFEPVSAEDVMLFAKRAAGVSLTPEAATYLVRRSNGCFRDVYGYMFTIEDYAAAQGANSIDVSALKRLNLGGSR